MKYLTTNIVTDNESNYVKIIYCLPISQWFKNGENNEIYFEQYLQTTAGDLNPWLVSNASASIPELNQDFNTAKNLIETSIIGIVE